MKVYENSGRIYSAFAAIQAAVCSQIRDSFHWHLRFCGPGEQQPDSDLDVFVELEEPDFYIMCDIRETLQQMCGCNVDLLRLRKGIRSLLLKRIEQDGVYA